MKHLDCLQLMIGKTDFSHDVHIRCCPFSPSIKVFFQDFGPASFKGKRLLKVWTLRVLIGQEKGRELGFIKRRKGTKFGAVRTMDIV